MSPTSCRARRLGVAPLVALIAFVNLAAGCGILFPAVRTPAWLLPGPNLTSFIGVRFGESMVRVQLRYRGGEIETSPNGADAYRLRGVTVGSIKYEMVLFEFSSEAGMQLAFAKFAPASSDEVLAHLKLTFGEPDIVRQGQAPGSQNLEVVWELPRGERISFNGMQRVVVLLGPGGAGLRQDIRPRLESPDL
ncbi:MAG: hypothetical protein ACREQF_07525 [Candidatus Binataceae bacterium]